MSNPSVCLFVTTYSPSTKLNPLFDLIDLSLEKQVVLTDLDTLISWAAPLGFHYSITYGGVIADSQILEYVVSDYTNLWNLPTEVVNFAKEQTKKPKDFEESLTTVPVHEIELIKNGNLILNIKGILLVDEIKDTHLIKLKTLFNEATYRTVRQEFIDQSLRVYIDNGDFTGIKGYKECTSLTLEEINKLEVSQKVWKSMHLYGYARWFIGHINIKDLIRNRDNCQPKLDSYKKYRFRFYF